ncbi:MAG: hypothetical protein AB1486_04345 [Planctomycetota bacterium]
MKKAALVILVSGLAAFSAGAKERWEFLLEPVEIGTLLGNGLEGPGLYLYLVYDLTNRSIDSAPLGVTLRVETDIPNLVYWDRVDPLVEEGLAPRGFVDLKNAADLRAGEIGAGEKLRCLAVFGKLSPHVDKLDIVVTGLVDAVSLKGGRRTVENRALVLHYSRPGDEFYPQRRPLFLQKKEWRVLSRQERPYR